MDAFTRAIKTSLPKANYVDFTIKFKETDGVVSLQRWAQQAPAVAWAEYDDTVTRTLLSKYPMKDIGLLLIHGRLPPSVRSYNVDNIFNVRPLEALSEDPGHGFGLVIGADDEKAHVQFLDSVQPMTCVEIAYNYKHFVIGMPFPRPPGTA